MQKKGERRTNSEQTARIPASDVARAVAERATEPEEDDGFDFARTSVHDGSSVDETADVIAPSGPAHPSAPSAPSPPPRQAAANPPPLEMGWTLGPMKPRDAPPPWLKDTPPSKPVPKPPTFV